MTALQTEIEARLQSLEPEVEVLLAEVVAGPPCASTSIIPTA